MDATTIDTVNDTDVDEDTKNIRTILISVFAVLVTAVLTIVIVIVTVRRMRRREYEKLVEEPCCSTGSGFKSLDNTSDFSDSVHL